MSLILKRLGVAVAVFVLSGTAILIATLFLFVSIYFAFAEHLSPPLAALATAGTLIGFALAVIGAGAIIIARLKQRPRQRFEWLLELLDAPEGLSAAAIGNFIGRRLQSIVQKNGQAALIVSLLAGAAVGFSPGLRALLRDLLKE